jgi:hypothetical protein
VQFIFRSRQAIVKRDQWNFFVHCFQYNVQWETSTKISWMRGAAITGTDTDSAFALWLMRRLIQVALELAIAEHWTRKKNYISLFSLTVYVQCSSHRVILVAERRMTHDTVKTLWIIKPAMMDYNIPYKQAATKQVMRKLSGRLRSRNKSGTYIPAHSTLCIVVWLKTVTIWRRKFSGIFLFISLLVVYLTTLFQLYTLGRQMFEWLLIWIMEETE